MKIGIDISSLQGLHRMRGIGYVTNHFIKNIPNQSPDTFVFYIYKNGRKIIDKEILKNISLESSDYEVRCMSPPNDKRGEFTGRLKYLFKSFSKPKTLASYILGSHKYGNVKDLDAFIQLDQSEPLARLRKGAKNYFIAYDLIPYVLEKDYLWGYHTARLNGKKRLGAIKCVVKRYMYIWKLKINTKKAHKVIAISKATKYDFEKILKVPSKKIEVISLGIDNTSAQNKKINSDGLVDRYYYTPWGYITKRDSLKNVDFLLFVGGVDPRRKLDDVVTAFNHLRGQGKDIKLVLSGDVMKGPLVIDTEPVRKALLDSSYYDDIYFLGFTSDEKRDWLYSKALAFIFPSIYEGVGLPVLEAMRYHTPVIAYDNKAVREVAGDCPIYANDPLSIVEAVKKLLSYKEKEINKLTDKAYYQSLKYTWGKTAKSILEIVSGDKS